MLTAPVSGPLFGKRAPRKKATRSDSSVFSAPPEMFVYALNYFYIAKWIYRFWHASRIQIEIENTLATAIKGSSTEYLRLNLHFLA